MDLDEEIWHAVTDVFTAFETTASACGVVAAFRRRRFHTL